MFETSQIYCRTHCELHSKYLGTNFSVRHRMKRRNIIDKNKENFNSFSKRTSYRLAN